MITRIHIAFVSQKSIVKARTNQVKAHPRAQRSKLYVMAMWKKIVIVVVAWVVSVLVYLEFFAKAR
jgi:hypothetical protein